MLGRRFDGGLRGRIGYPEPRHLDDGVHRKLLGDTSEGDWSSKPQLVADDGDANRELPVESLVVALLEGRRQILEQPGVPDIAVWLSQVWTSSKP